MTHYFQNVLITDKSFAIFVDLKETGFTKQFGAIAIGTKNADSEICKIICDLFRTVLFLLQHHAPVDHNSFLLSIPFRDKPN